MKKRTIFIFILVLAIFHLFGQGPQVQGSVLGKSENHKEETLSYANVYWADTQVGVLTDERGHFSIYPQEGKGKKLVASHVGYRNDTIEIRDKTRNIRFVLIPDLILKEVEVVSRQQGNFISTLNPLKTEVITSTGLQRLPCCNLSESFENSASVDVGYTDAVSGAKQIQLLGLAGTYSQLLTECIPSLRGLASTYGLSYIPGPWMESIQISKGSASVINGYESMTGQINVDLKKPESSSKLYINLFGDEKLRMEANILTAHKLSDTWSTMLMAYGTMMNKEHDMNHDGFMDMPKNKQLNFLSRWTYDGKQKLKQQLSVQYLFDDRKGGQFHEHDETHGIPRYSIDVQTNRLQLSGKSGFVFPVKHRGLGIQYSGTWHEQKSHFGLRYYNATQKSLYGNLIYNSIIGLEVSRISFGASYMLDDYQERINDSVFNRTESVPGAFAEYSFEKHPTFIVIGGLRLDYNNRQGLFFTPRFHLRYKLNEVTTLRVSVGKGFRTVNLIAENIGILASSRNLVVEEALKPEESWNYGLNFTREFPIDDIRKVVFTFDLYRTDFINQVIIDADRSPFSVFFYNLDGKSYSNSMQAEFRVIPFDRFEVVTAFRVNDVKMTINGTLQEKPLSSLYKGLLTLSYATRFNKWMFDVTTQLNGPGRMPDTDQYPSEYRNKSTFPSYLILHAQITRDFKYFEIYAGAENLTNYRQADPIIAADDPFGRYFNASMIWGPLTGRMFYAGLRFNL